MVQARPHLLLLGWYRPGTGFTRVLSALAQRLARHYRITWFGVGYQGPAQQLSDQVWLEPTNLRGGDMVGAYAVRARWQQLAVDAILALNDLWYLKHYSEVLGPIRGRVPMLGYLPLDGRIARSDQVQGVDGFSALVTYTQSAAADLRVAASAASFTRLARSAPVKPGVSAAISSMKGCRCSGQCCAANASIITDASSPRMA